MKSVEWSKRGLKKGFGHRNSNARIGFRKEFVGVKNRCK